jgi:HEAT repeat protein
LQINVLNAMLTTKRKTDDAIFHCGVPPFAISLPQSGELVRNISFSSSGRAAAAPASNFSIDHDRAVPIGGRPMKKRTVILLCFAAFCGAIWFILGGYASPGEPVWQGKKLSQWLVECNSDNPRDLTASAQKAIRAMGTNILPFLLNMVATTDSSAKMKLRAWAGKGSIIRKLTTPTHFNFRISAAAGFEALGKEAAPAVPELIKMLNDEQTEYPAVLALSAIGPSAVPLLMQTLTNRSAFTRMGALQALSFMHGAEEAIPGLLRCLDDPEPAVRGEAAFALGDMRKQPDRVVPKLMERLADTNSSVRADAAVALGLFGAQARMAVPKLMELQNDSSIEVRQQAIAALKKVASVSTNQ